MIDCAMSWAQVMRHNKAQVLEGSATALLVLPPRTSTTQIVEMSARERTLYNHLDDHARRDFRSIVATAGYGRRTLKIMALLLPLRNFAVRMPAGDPSYSRQQATHRKVR